MEENIIEEVLEKNVLNKISPLSRLRSVLKKILFFIITLKWILETIKLTWSLGGKCANHMRKALKLSITDKYDEGGVWATVLWIKFWAIAFGFIGGYLLHYFELFTKIDEWVELIIDAVG